ncbi:MAG: amidoligase family protein [Acetobacteraceae bacterium]
MASSSPGFVTQATVVREPADIADRCVGVELEFLGLSAADAARALARGLGGSVTAEDPHAWRVQGGRLGDMSVETDLRLVHPQRQHGSGVRKLPPWIAAILGSVLSPVVPRELIVSPIQARRLIEIDDAVTVLRSAGARGRGVVLLDSLSLHFNVAPPATDAATLTACLKAFLILEPRLRDHIARGRLRHRRALPPPYPDAYRRRVLSPDYRPDLPGLMADYLAANPTRKRGLDMLPMFAHLDEARVRSVLPLEKIGPRPVLHYRMAQAHLSEPGWSIMPDWRRWLSVEALAADPEALQQQGRAAVTQGQ